MAIEFEVEEPIGSVGLFRVVGLSVVHVFIRVLRGSDGAVKFDHPEASVLLLIEFHLVVVADNDARQVFLSRLPLVVLEGAHGPIPGVNEEVAVMRILVHIIGVVVVFRFVLLVLLHLLFLDLLLGCISLVLSRWHRRQRLFIFIGLYIQRLNLLCQRFHLADADIVDVGIERDMNRCASFSRTSVFYKKQECFRLLIILIEKQDILGCKTSLKSKRSHKIW